MRFLFVLALALLALRPVATFAQPVVVSKAPDAVSVTVYRDPSRGLDTPIDLGEPLGGYALISETRTLDLPPGRITIRFEGVASGIQPESAIVRGTDVAERNQDRLLLSKRGLLDAFTGQRIVVRRTDPATGKVTREPARLRSGAGRVVIETAAGFESLDCTGLSQAPLFPGVPRSLSAKPVLSVTTVEQAGGRQQVTLSYLAANFDWQANYVGELDADASAVDLFAWVTLASADATSFVDAGVNAVAGRVERAEREDEDEDVDGDDKDEIYASCWPSGTTGGGPLFGPAALPELRAPIVLLADGYGGYGGDEGDQIIVTGTRIVSQEALGDLKLYRVPFPVTLASNSQKQVAFLSRPKVRGELLYRSRFAGWGDGDVELVFRARNVKESGLGEPLPTGQVALFQLIAGRRMLVGEGKIPDTAIREDFEFVFAEAQNVDTFVEDLSEGKDGDRKRLTVTNDRPHPIRYEAEFQASDDARYDKFGKRMLRRDGRLVWRVTVPANGEASLDFRQIDLED